MFFIKLKLLTATKTANTDYINMTCPLISGREIFFNIQVNIGGL
jgi:hypothetical protein